MAADPAPAALVPAAWTAIGPSVMRNGQAFSRPPVSGRVPSIALSRYADVAYVATSNGGVWRSDDGGGSWRPLMDPQDNNPLNLNGRADSLACGAVAIHPDHPEQVFVGSGEAFGAIDSFLGIGAMVSPDGGRTWVTEAVNGAAIAGNGFYALAVDPTNPDRVVGATRTGLYRRELLVGVWTWVQKALNAPGSPNRDASSVVCVRGVFYAALRPGGVGQPSLVLRSVDQGQTWNPVGTGFPAAAGRVTLAVHPERSDVVYAALQNGDLYRLRLNAAGLTGPWRKVNWTPAPAGISAFVGTQGWYDLALSVDPGDVDTVYCGGSTVAVDIAGNVKAASTVATDVFSSSIWRVRIRPVGAALQAQPTYIGHTVHADVHALVFPRGLPGQMWVGCDGGVFATDSVQAPRPAFRSLNSGLATSLVNALAQHPTEPAVMFGAMQDNGGQRSIGDEAWSLTTEGDAGWCVVDWNNPYRVLMTYTSLSVQRCTDGGNSPASWSDVAVARVPGDSVDFYAPLAGAPQSGVAADASRVAFGTRHLWLSDNFALLNPPSVAAPALGDWHSLPSNTVVTVDSVDPNDGTIIGHLPGGAAADRLPNTISAITFATVQIIYVGTGGGGVYRYVQAANPGPWVRTQIDTIGAAILPLASAITDIAADPTDASGNSVYVVLGGSGDRRHLWHYNNATWTDRSGPAGPTGLLDVQANAIAVDPGNPTHLYLATDVGVWSSTDSGATWRPWGTGLPEAAATDLLIHNPSRLIRVATHGRGVFMRRLGAAGALPPLTTAPVELYLRKHRLDLGLGLDVTPAVYGQPDPTNSAAVIAKGISPDIRCDAPDAAGAYRFSADRQLSLVDFFQLADDDSANVPTAAQPVLTRVQVLVHNRGPRWAHDVRVAVLIAPGRHGTLPDLPLGWAARLRAGQDVVGGGWRTVGQITLSDLRPGAPQVATLALSSALLPQPGAALVGHTDHTLLVAVHHADDPLLSDAVDAEAVADGMRAVALRHLTVVAYHPIAAVGPTVLSRFLPIGPSPMLNGLAQGGPPVAGRTPGLAISRHGDIVYAGTANGGVWRSDDGGATWQSCMDAFDLDPAVLRTDSLACPAVAIHPDHPERVFVGTGEPFGNTDAYFGVGMLVSLDRGRNWLREPTVAGPKPVGAVVVPLPTPLTESALLLQRGCYTVVVDPNSPDRAIAATSVGAFLRESDGVGGFRWRRTWFATAVNGAGGATAATEIPDVTSLTCAAAGGVTHFVAVLRGGQVYRFTTGDAEFAAGQPLWRPLGQATWPAQGGSRCTIAMKPDDASVVYLVRADGNAFRFDAGTAAWATITPMPVDLQGNTWIGTQGWYDLALAVDPRNVNRIAIGGSTVKAVNDALAAAGAVGANWFSSIWACTIAPAGANWSLAAAYIGARAHADVHRLVFTPGDGRQLWTGCDGGVFRCDGWDQPGAFFIPRNRGLSTLSGNSVDTHPVEDALLLLSTQDNGAALGGGTPGWRMVLQGDSGAAIWHWGDALAGIPVRVLITYIQHTIHRFSAGGTAYADPVSVAGGGDGVAFYPPVIGAPLNAATPAQASRVVFGGQRLWLSDLFGGPSPAPNPPGTGDWASLPSGAVADRLPGGQLITSIAFLAFDRIVVGTSTGNCFLYERPAPAAAWIGPQPLALAGTWPLPTPPAPAAVPGEPAPIAPPPPAVTGLCRDSGDATNRTFFACLGGSAGRQRVWRAQITLSGAGAVTAVTWTPRSGAAAKQLLDVHHNAIVADGGDLYVAADIGLWRSADGGLNWLPFADGLPDAPLMDLELAPNRILRVSSHGRGTYERQLPAAPVPRVRLVVRETLLDRGLRPAAYGGVDHLGTVTVAAASPDILVDAPQAGVYQTSPNLGLDHITFAGLSDRSGAVATHAAGVVNRVHVQVQNTGPESCHGATVMLLLAEAVAGAPPPLPADHVAAVRCGAAVGGGGWTTVGIRTLAALDSREPAIASFDLHSSLLPAPGALAGHGAWHLLALVSHELDPFPDPATAVPALATTNRHAALKAITVAALAGDAPAVQGPPRAIPAALPLATAIAADRRLKALANDSLIRQNLGAALGDTDRALDALVKSAAAHLRAGPALPVAADAMASGLGRYVALGAIGLDLPDWADYLESRPGWMRTALRRGSADEDISATVADALTVVSLTASYALAATNDVNQQARIRAFCAGMACAVATEIVIGPVLRGAAALRGPADPGASGHADRAIAETWVSRVLLGGAAERSEFSGWFPDDSDLPPALLTALVRALTETISAEMATRRVATTPAPTLATPPALDDLTEGLGLWQSVRTQSSWGMGTWFAVLLPVFLAPALGVMLSRFGEHSGRLLKISDESKGPDDPANDSDEKSWYQVANFTLGCGIPAPFAYNLALWSIVPRRDADFVQFTVAGGLRTIFAVVAAATMSAPTGLRWGLVFTPWIATDLYFLVRSLVDYAQGRPGSGFMKMIQVLPLMGLSVAWLFCLLIRRANLRRDGQFWPMWGLFTGLLLGGGLVMAWRMAAGGGLVQMLRDRQDPVLKFDAFAGRDLLSLPAARALVYPDHQLWQQGAGVAGERYPAGMRPLLKLWHADSGWQIRPWSDRVEFSHNDEAPITVALPKVQDAAQLLASLSAAVAGLQGAVVDPAGFDLLWPVRLASHGDDQPTWAAHDREADLWRGIGSSEAKAYLLRHAPRSRSASGIGAPTGVWSPAEGPLKVVPDRDATDPLGTDLVGTALGRAGDLAALFQMALAPVFTPNLQAQLAAGPAPLSAGREVLRRWNLDERREAEWRLLVGLDALPDQAPERLAPGAAVPSSGEAIAVAGVLPALAAWGNALRDDRVNLYANTSSPAMPLIRPRGDAPRSLLHTELRDALKALLNVP